MNTNSVSKHLVALFQSGNNVQLLKEGNSVLVRVLANRGNGQYEVNVAGKRMSIKSEIPLKSGQSFISTIAFKDSKILLTKTENAANPNQTVNNPPSLELLSLEDNLSVNQFLTGLNVIPDNLSLQLVMQFKQLGLRLDSILINKIRNLSVKFTNRQELAAQLLAVLHKKGLTLSDSQIEELLDILENQNEKELLDASFEEKTLESEFGIEKLIAAFKDYASEIFGEELQNKTGTLTILNHLQGKDKSGNWIFLPFEIIKNDKDSDLTKNFRAGNGLIKLLFKNDMLSKLILDTNYLNDKYIFECIFESNKLKFINYATTNDIEEKLNHSELHKKNILINKVLMEDLKGTACTTEKLYFFDSKI